MHATGILAQCLAQHSVIGHRAREAALLKLVEAVLGGSKLSLTQLGRYRPGTAYTKHHIKAADRLLGNRHLHAERDGIYRAIRGLCSRAPSAHSSWSIGPTPTFVGDG